MLVACQEALLPTEIGASTRMICIEIKLFKSTYRIPLGLQSANEGVSGAAMEVFRSIVSKSHNDLL